MDVVNQLNVVIQGPDSPCLGAVNQIYRLNQPYSTYKWDVTGGTISNGINGKAFVSVDWGSTLPALINVTVTEGNCSEKATLAVNFYPKNALPESTIIKKPSEDILIFDYQKSVYPEPIVYAWGALEVIDETLGIVKPVVLKDTIDGVKVYKDRQYYYVKSIKPSPPYFYYLDISTKGGGCTTRCYWPDNPYLRLGGDIDPPENNPEIPLKALVMPNPNNGVFNVQLPQVYQEEVNYQLYNVMGSVVNAGKSVVSSNMITLDFTPGHFTPGIYFLEIYKEHFGFYNILKVIIK